MTWLRGSRCTDPEEMPEKEARPPAQNRHGGAPRGERVPLDARRASPGAFKRRSRVSPRSVSRGVYPRAARSADPGARPGHESGAVAQPATLAAAALLA